MNFAFDTISPNILSLQVRTGWWIFGQIRLIPRSKITRITEKAIFINDQGLKVKTEEEDAHKGDNPIADQP